MLLPRASSLRRSCGRQCVLKPKSHCLSEPRATAVTHRSCHIRAHNALLPLWNSARATDIAFPAELSPKAVHRPTTRQRLRGRRHTLVHQPVARCWMQGKRRGWMHAHRVWPNAARSASCRSQDTCHWAMEEEDHRGQPQRATQRYCVLTRPVQIRFARNETALDQPLGVLGTALVPPQRAGSSL